jgi:kynurenine formamidase
MRVLDLTHLINEQITVYPGTEKPVFEKIDVDGYRELKMHMFTHTGTHIDAPYHIIRDAPTLDRLPFESFIGSAIVVDCKALAGKQIGLEFLRKFEKQIAITDFLLLKSGWSDKWGSDDYFYDFPTLTIESAEWLTNFKLKGIGLDCISLDIVNSHELLNHHIVLGKGMVIIENLTNLDILPDEGFIFQCFPLKIESADGSPVRALAVLNP